MRRTIIYILSTAIISASAIACFFMIANRIPANGFERNVVDVSLKHIKTIDLKSKSIVFAGTSEVPLMLKDFRDPKVIYNAESKSGQIVKSSLELPIDFNLSSGYVNVGTALKRIFVTNGKTGDVLILQIKSKKLRHNIPDLRFDQSIVISNNSVIIRTKKTEPQRYREITKLSFQGNQLVKKSLRLPRQIDGIFCTDGWLQYDHLNDRLSYTYYYRGQFLYLDTNLRVLYTAKTIDTVTTAKIKIGIVSSRLNDSTYVEQRTQITPPPTINLHHTSDADRIYILSTLKADNEASSAFKENQVIDVYSNVNGKYIYSFYVPKYLGSKLRQFRIRNNRIYCIFKNYLVEFSFNAS